jgi:NifU-like protein involved in Fe-S cluster formation
VGLAGAMRADIERLQQEIAAMLKAEAAAPAPPFEAYTAFEGAVEHASRHRCVLLPLEAVLAAFESTTGAANIQIES